MTIIEDLVSLETFMREAVATIEADHFVPISNGEEGVQELQHFFEKTGRPGETVCFFQMAEIPLTDNDAGYSKATFATTLMLIQKMAAPKITWQLKLNTRNELLKKMLALVGNLVLASDWFVRAYNEQGNESYDVTITVFQDRILPVGRIANVNLQGWLVDIDVSIPVNTLMYGAGQ